MNDTTTEPKFGRDAELSEAGYSSAAHVDDQGTAWSKKPERSDDEVTARQAADELRTRRDAEAPIRERKFEDAGEHKTALTTEQAAKVLQVQRDDDQKITDAAEQLRNQETRDQIDRSRGIMTDGELKDFQEKLVIEEDRKAGEAHARAVQEAQAREQAAANQRAQQIDATEQRVQGARMAQLSAIAQEFPELQNLGDLSQLPSAVAAIEAKSPQRAQALRSRIGNLVAFNRQHAAIQHHKQQHANTEFERYAKNQDATFLAKHSRDPDFRATMEGIAGVLGDHGIDAREFVQLASTPAGSFLRDARVASLLYSMSKALSKPTLESIQAKKAPAAIPPVVHPGTTAPLPRPLAGAALQSKLNATLKQGGDAALRAAARAVMEKRRGR